MNTCLRKTLLSMITLIVFAISPIQSVFAQNNEANLIIATEVGGTHQTSIPFVFKNTEHNEAALYIYLRNEGNAEISGLKLGVASLKDTTNDQLVGGYNISFAIDNQEFPADGLTIPPQAEVDVKLEITNFTHEGEFSGELLAKTGDSLLVGTKLIVTRIPKPDLAIVGFGDNGIELTQLKNEFEYSLHIYSINTSPVNDLQIELDDFIIAGGSSIKPGNFAVYNSNDEVLDPRLRDDHKFYNIDGLGGLTVKFTMEINEAGEYSSQINLVYDKHRISRLIKITRTRPATSVEILGLNNPIIATTNNVHLWMVLSENKGQQNTVDLPRIITLDRREDETTNSQAFLPTLEISSPLKDNSAIKADTIALASMDTVQLEMQILGINRPGEYNGIIELGNAESMPIRQNIKIFVREPGYIAFICIFLGILFSLLLRYALPALEGKARFRAGIRGEQTDVLTLQKMAGFKDTDTQLLDHLKDRLITLWQLTYENTQVTPEMTTEFKDIQTTIDFIPELLDLRAGTDGLPNDLKGRFENEADAQVQLIRDATKAEKAREQLRTIKSDILRDLKESIKGKIQRRDAIWFLDDPQVNAKWETRYSGLLSGLVEFPMLQNTIKGFWIAYAKYLQDLSNLILDSTTDMDADVKDQMQKISNNSLQNTTKADVQVILQTYDEARRIHTEKQNKAVEESPPIDSDRFLIRYAASFKWPSTEAKLVDPSTDRERQLRFARQVRGIIICIAFAVAVISGYYILYLDHLTWGGWPDRIVALLWGLGLFEVSNAALMKTFPGVQSLADTLTS